jgi:mono/diheme cytochrome c family protein
MRSFANATAAVVVSLGALLGLGLGACAKNTQPPPPSSGSPNAKPESGPSRPRAGEPSQGQQLFGMMCATCHGMDGTGNGPGAAGLNPRPRNYTDAAWQASITDEQIKETILKGGGGVGKSPAMPGQPQLSEHPEVLDELVAIIRGFGKHP